MKMNAQRFFLLLIVLASFGLAGCSSASKKEEEGDKVSTLPWSQPEKWEKGSPMGGGGGGASY